MSSSSNDLFSAFHSLPPISKATCRAAFQHNPTGEWLSLLIVVGLGTLFLPFHSRPPPSAARLDLSHVLQSSRTYHSTTASSTPATRKDFPPFSSSSVRLRARAVWQISLRCSGVRSLVANTWYVYSLRTRKNGTDETRERIERRAMLRVSTRNRSSLCSMVLLQPDVRTLTLCLIVQPLTLATISQLRPLPHLLPSLVEIRSLRPDRHLLPPPLAPQASTLPLLPRSRLHALNRPRSPHPPVRLF